MCGIFGYFSKNGIPLNDLAWLTSAAETRGRDTSGIVSFSRKQIQVSRGHSTITARAKALALEGLFGVAGHGRLITNGDADNQPVVAHGVIVIHNGIIVNDEEIWENLSLKRTLDIDTEVLCALVRRYVDKHGSIKDIGEYLGRKIKGSASVLCFVPNLNVAFCWSNTGDLFVYSDVVKTIISSEKSAFPENKRQHVIQIFEKEVGIQLFGSIEDQPVEVSDDDQSNRPHKVNFVNKLRMHDVEYDRLEYLHFSGRRCSKCILPETMPFIEFDLHGVCNYCHNYSPRNKPKDISQLEAVINRYRKGGEQEECIIPFSGGRDSCFALHYASEVMGLKCVTFTYDWGMVTDLGRRNISRMTSILGVRNLVFAANISQKRRNIEKNLTAWLKRPELGMISILTAGDKHFFKYVDHAKKMTGVDLNIWGINPLEITHFKAGFLGLPPNFGEKKVYNSNARAQLRYQSLRFGAMMRSPRYFNSSLWDTVSGEYYRTFMKKSDYYHIFDYVKWDEGEIDRTLLDKYDWELAPDTSCTWRIGDGTAAFYNYIYYTVAGFTEHDTFRSNQIREGDIDRKTALSLVQEENKPRGPNIRWYLESVGHEFSKVIDVVNNIPKLRRDL